MKKILYLSCLGLTLFLAGCSQIPGLSKKQSALQVTSTPAASVYVNGNHMGQTPFLDDKLKPGDYTVRILVENDPSKDWQTQVKLNPSVVTVVNRQFGSVSDESSSYTLTFEPITSKDSGQLDVTTSPENVIIKIDGKPEGFSPLHLENVTEGDHAINLTAPGYQELSVNTKTKNGYKLILSAQLARTSETAEPADLNIATESAQLATPSGTPKPTGKVTPTPTPKTSPTPSPKISGTPAPTKAATSGAIQPPYVTIKETGTGWLRVRSEPEVGDNEVAKVDVGDQFPYLDKTEDGWYKIEYETGKEGWIVSRYADLTE